MKNRENVVIKNHERERLLNILLSPHVSEKATIATSKRNEYVFRVASDATKTEIKAAMLFLFNVKPKSICIVNVKPKKKLFRGVEGLRKGWKKAYVTLQAGQTLDMMEVAR